MRIPLPRPLHGWRVFVGEVGVIVLGVLLALGAQQFAEEMQIRGEVENFRKTIDQEIALNLFTYDVRARQHACIRTRVSQLNEWLDRANAGEDVPALRVRTPDIFSQYRSAWDNRNATVFQHLPDDVRANYAEFYDELANNGALIAADKVAWLELVPYMVAGPVSLDDRRRIRSAINRVGEYNESLAGNIVLSREIAKKLGVSQVRPQGLSAVFEVDLGKCEAVVAAL